MIYCSSARPRKLTATKFDTRGEKGQQKLHIFGFRILHLAFVSARWFILSNQADDGVVKTDGIPRNAFLPPTLFLGTLGGLPYLIVINYGKLKLSEKPILIN